MKRILIYTAIAFGFLLSNCEKNNDDPINSMDNDNAIIVDNALYNNAPDDEFEFADAQIINDSIKLTIRYGGGCGEIELILIDSDNVMESLPPQRNIRLSLKDDDTCEAYLTKVISFDLTPIRVAYVNQVSINLEGWSSPLIYNY